MQPNEENLVDQAILAMLGIIITLMLYLDRGRRADIAQLRSESLGGFKELRADNARLRKETNRHNQQVRKEVNDGFKRVYRRLDKLTDVVMDLCRRVGRLEGRAEASETTTTTPAQ